MRTLNSTGLTEGLIPANKALTSHITKGITVTEFVDGEKTSKTIPLIDWIDVGANEFHVVEEFSVQRPGGFGNYRPDIVAFVNGIPLAIIEAKRPVSTTRDKAMVEEGISQHLRNQQETASRTSMPIRSCFCRFPARRALCDHWHQEEVLVALARGRAVRG